MNDDTSAPSRRDVVRKGLIGAGIAATAPIAMSMNVRAGAAASDPAPVAVCTAANTSGMNMMGATTVVITGAIAGATVFVYDAAVVTDCSGTAAGSGTANASGSVTIVIPADGPDFITVSQDDGTGEGQCSVVITCA